MSEFEVFPEGQVPHASEPFEAWTITTIVENQTEKYTMTLRALQVRQHISFPKDENLPAFRLKVMSPLPDEMGFMGVGLLMEADGRYSQVVHEVKDEEWRKNYGALRG